MISFSLQVSYMYEGFDYRVCPIYKYSNESNFNRAPLWHQCGVVGHNMDEYISRRRFSFQKLLALAVAMRLVSRSQTHVRVWLRETRSLLFS